jgi:hypothetical protein
VRRVRLREGGIESTTRTHTHSHTHAHSHTHTHAHTPLQTCKRDEACERRKSESSWRHFGRVLAVRWVREENKRPVLCIWVLLARKARKSSVVTSMSVCAACVHSNRPPQRHTHTPRSGESGSRQKRVAFLAPRGCVLPQGVCVCVCGVSSLLSCSLLLSPALSAGL